MKMDSKLKVSMFLILYALMIYFLLLHFHYVWSMIQKTICILTPFIYGFLIAYIVNWPYEFFRCKINYKKLHINPIFKTSISLICAYIFVFGIVTFIFFIIAPQLILSVEHLVNNFSSYVDSLSDMVDSVYKYSKISILPKGYTQTVIKNMESYLEDFVKELVPNVFNFTKNFAVGIYNWIVGIVVSFYLLGSKERLINQFNVLVSFCFPKNMSEKLFKVLNLSNDTFGKFLIGKSLDSLIIGIICFIGTVICRIPYSMLISVIVGVTNIIPFFGPFIGAVPCIFILLMVDPIKSLWFTIFIIILQQIDGNIIGPKILGNSVGISGIWIMFSVIIGGGLFGVPGMILGVPIFTVIYIIVREMIQKKQRLNIK